MDELFELIPQFSHHGAAAEKDLLRKEKCFGAGGNGGREYGHGKPLAGEVQSGVVHLIRQFLALSIKARFVRSLAE